MGFPMLTQSCFPGCRDWRLPPQMNYHIYNLDFTAVDDRRGDEIYCFMSRDGRIYTISGESSSQWAGVRCVVSQYFRMYQVDY